MCFISRSLQYLYSSDHPELILSSTLNVEASCPRFDPRTGEWNSVTLARDRGPTGEEECMCVCVHVFVEVVVDTCVGAEMVVEESTVGGPGM